LACLVLGSRVRDRPGLLASHAGLGWADLFGLFDWAGVAFVGWAHRVEPAGELTAAILDGALCVQLSSV
jgi:hypothetical protein